MNDKKSYEQVLEEGQKKAQEFLEGYGLGGAVLTEQFEFREIRSEEAEQAVQIEQICFPPNEACTEKMMLERVAAIPELFLVAADRETGKIAGLINGLATDRESLQDDFFRDASLHNPQGRNVMILGVEVLPEYQGKGIAKELMYQYLRKEQERGRKMVVLTCLESKIKMYEKMGFRNLGIAQSVRGGEQWYEMSCVLNI